MDPREAFDEFRAQFPAKAMKIAPRHSDEMIRMVPGDGMVSLPSAADPAVTIASSPLPNSEPAADAGRNLWVVSPADFPMAQEKCSWGRRLSGKKIKHSNLTGGDDAHSGGEIWFVDRDRVVVNSNSGRYGADSIEEFDAVVLALRKCGYYVASMGFDLDNPRAPNSVLIGDPEWLHPLNDNESN